MTIPTIAFAWKAPRVSFLSEAPANKVPEGASAIWIPSSACRHESGAKGGEVFLVVEGQFRQTPITLGREVGGQVEVVGGLSPGQSIAADGLDRIRDGTRVRS
jgi:multidrug efflux pump subunit AcrA (membrane-fusion protein)